MKLLLVWHCCVCHGAWGCHWWLRWQVGTEWLPGATWVWFQFKLLNSDQPCAVFLVWCCFKCWQNRSAVLLGVGHCAKRSWDCPADCGQVSACCRGPASPSELGLLERLWGWPAGSAQGSWSQPGWAWSRTGILVLEALSAMARYVRGCQAQERLDHDATFWSMNWPKHLNL